MVKRKIFFTLISVVISCTACTTMMPRKDLPLFTTKDYGDPVKVVSIPLPAISTDPNEGLTSGVLGAFLIYDKKGGVRTLFAPQVNYNSYYGATETFYGAFYPRDGQSWEANISRSQHVNFDYELTFRDMDHLVKGVGLNAYVYYFNNGSSRFFGFQSSSALRNQTNYGDQEAGFDFSATFDVLPDFYISLGDRLRRVTITHGAVLSLPFIQDVFTPEEVPGINGFRTHAQRFSLIYSTLNSREMPTAGFYSKATAEWSGKALGSSANFFHYFLEAKDYMPASKERYVTLLRASYDQTIGNSVPFLERSILGGEDTLRGYGDNRFIDKSYVLFNFEERIRLFTRSVFNVNTRWELAPFLDVGNVMSSLYSISTKGFKINPGLGFRATVPPNIVGRIDVGFGNEGPAVFVGLGYPFSN
ncbi:MAG: BamA/TamA family outer membrane protein [Nitrospiraceae bacterium]|nr:BamA/TamA family outer membrane protein [Nitrospiraceae bacterium]